MPNYDAIVISAATINAKCHNCKRPLDTDASLNLKYGFYEKCFCPDCLMNILGGYPQVQKDLAGTTVDMDKMLELLEGQAKTIELLATEFQKLKEKANGDKKTETKPKTEIKPEAKG